MINHVGHKLTAPYLTDYEKLISFFLSLVFAGSFNKCLVTVPATIPTAPLLEPMRRSQPMGLPWVMQLLRGYVDFIFGYDDEDGADQNEQFDTTADVDFLFDLSPITLNYICRVGFNW